MKDEMYGLAQDEELIDVAKIYESLRYNDYSTENGLGELIDNSVESGADQIRIYFEKIKQKIGKRENEIIDKITVLDNGDGMSEEVISKCLKLGYSKREIHNGALGIGKFGVGMTLGGISLARRIDVYSRNMKEKEFLHTFIDLDKISSREIVTMPRPKAEKLPEKYKEFFKNSTGTLVILSKCDRLDGGGHRIDANEIYAKIANYLGRTYRKFIEGGLKMWLDDKLVYLHDPLYISGPTQFDSREKQDPKATLYSQSKIEWEIPGKKGETAEITIKLSLLPKEWRLSIGDGGSPEAKKRKIDQNEGISILRAKREVLYDKVPYLIGAKGRAAYERIDRWWGCEISFPPELDECFQVRYIKRGAEPIGPLKDRIKEEITAAINSLRKIIRSDRAQMEAEENRDSNVFGRAEELMRNINSVLPKSKAGRDMEKGEEQKKLDEILQETLLLSDTEEQNELKKKEKKKQMYESPYSVVAVSYPQNILFEPEFLMEKVVIKLNVNHPFYQKIITPLCGTITKEENVELYNEKNRMKDAIMLLLISYCKAQASFEQNEKNTEILQNLLAQWGMILSTVVKQMED